MAEIYIYRNVNSTGARDLAVALGGKRVKQAPNMGAGDFLVCWGSSVGQRARNILNSGPINNKYEDALKLKEKGVATIEVALHKPNMPRHPAGAPVVPVRQAQLVPCRNFFDKAMELANDFVENDNPDFASPVFKRGVKELQDAVVGLYNSLGLPARVEPLQAPAPLPAVNAEWLGRRFHHVGGKDLLGLNKNPAQYFVRKEDIVEEYRVHSFLGKSIRAGKKVVREDVPANRRHAWVRSWDGGWKMAYEGVKASPELRNLAHSAVAALGLDFGAVDIGKLRNGRFIVLEVNRAPGIEGGTVVKYKEAIERWMRG